MTNGDLLAASGLVRADAELLLADAAGRDRAWVVAHERDDADAETAGRFMAYAKRRQAGEPVAYILGKKEFFGRSFDVGPGVLVPRPCTEAVVEEAIAFIDGHRARRDKDIDVGIACVVRPMRDLAGPYTLVDLGTGSGCIGVSVACEREGFGCVATDVSMDALETAQRNAERHGVVERFGFRKGDAFDVLANLDEPFLVVTNPPYVADEASLADDVRAFEPMTALIGGGNDGGDLSRSIMRAAKDHPFCVAVVMECRSAHVSTF